MKKSDSCRSDKERLTEIWEGQWGRGLLLSGAAQRGCNLRPRWSQLVLMLSYNGRHGHRRRLDGSSCNNATIQYCSRGRSSRGTPRCHLMLFSAAIM